jgi:hypothetical protein
MRYTHRKRGPKKTYGRKRHYRKKTIKRVGGGLRSCLPVSWRNKYNFNDSDTRDDINEKLKRWIINQDTPYRAREHMAQSWAAYLDHDSGDIHIKHKKRMEQRVRKLNERIISIKIANAARDPVANEEMTEEEFRAQLDHYLKEIEEEERYKAARNSACASV